MKKILITGANSYVGTSFEKWVSKWNEKYFVDTLDMINTDLSDCDFSNYDVVFHVAGIAHVSSDPKMKELYYKINRDLTIKTATKAKKDGVRQFIFMSSIIVYGDSSSINKERVIDITTVPQPTNFYGDSKLQAEAGIRSLEDDSFNIVILRPPMIYGKNSKGNYVKLSKLAKNLPFFPDVKNQRSMLHIDNLCEFIRLMIDNEERGLFFPQNKEYVITSDMVKTIAKYHNKRMLLIKIFNPMILLFSYFVNIINKVFGNLVYDMSMSQYKVEYRIRDFYKSIELTENEKG